MRYFYYLNLVIPKDLESEIDSYALKEFKSSGVEEFSIDEARVDEILGDRSYSGGDLPESVLDEVVSVVSSEDPQKKYHFLNQSDAKKFQSFLNLTYSLTSKLCEDEVLDWNEEWKKSYKPININEELLIIPSWEKGSDQTSNQRMLYIYPGMGFGTGSHETTYLCLKIFLESKLNSKLSSCLDFGCGSGILGICASLYNPGLKVDLYDIDQEALDNSFQNIELNELSADKFSMLLQKDRKNIERRYQLVFANILQNVLLEEKRFLTSSLEKNGELILSGLLVGQEEEVINSYQKINSNLKVLNTFTKGDWAAVHMVNK